MCAIVHEDLRDALMSVRDRCPLLRTSVVLEGKAGEGIDWDFDRLMEGADTEPDVDRQGDKGQEHGHRNRTEDQDTPAVVRSVIHVSSPFAP